MFDDAFIDSLAKAITPRLVELLAPRLKQEPMPAPEWLNRAQAGAYIGTTKEALRHMLRENLLPVYNVAGRHRIKKSDIDALFLSKRAFLKPDEISEELACVLPGESREDFSAFETEEQSAEFESVVDKVTEKTWDALNHALGDGYQITNVRDNMIRGWQHTAKKKRLKVKTPTS